MFNKAKALLGIQALSCILLLSAATAVSAANKQTSDTHDPVVIHVAWGPGASWDFAYAQYTHLWKRYGVQIDMVEGANGAALLSFLGSGKIQTATMAPSAMIVANSIGIPLRVVYADASTTEMGLYANPASGMTADARTWKGKTIGVAKNSEGDYGFRWSLAKGGMKPSDVNMLFLAPTVAVPAYQRKQIDGYYVWDVWGARLKAVGAKLVQRAVDVGFPSSSIWCMTKDFLRTQPVAAARFVAAMNAANVEMRKALAKGGAAADVVYAAIMKANGISHAAAADLLREQPPATIHTLLSSDSPLSFTSSSGLVSQVKQQARIAVETGAIKKMPSDPAEYLAPRSLFEAALKVHELHAAR